MTTCFGHRMTTLRSIRATIYMFLLLFYKTVNSTAIISEFMCLDVKHQNRIFKS